MTDENRRIAELEGQRRSLAMLQTNQLALTRDQGMKLYQQLLDALHELRRLVGESGWLEVGLVVAQRAWLVECRLWRALTGCDRLLAVSRVRLHLLILVGLAAVVLLLCQRGVEGLAAGGEVVG